MTDFICDLYFQYQSWVPVWCRSIIFITNSKRKINAIPLSFDDFFIVKLGKFFVSSAICMFVKRTCWESFSFTKPPKQNKLTKVTVLEF